MMWIVHSHSNSQENKPVSPGNSRHILLVQESQPPQHRQLSFGSSSFFLPIRLLLTTLIYDEYGQCHSGGEESLVRLPLSSKPGRFRWHTCLSHVTARVDL